MMMKYIKRLLVIALLLTISFFVYRLISPSGAKALLYDLKSFSNSSLGTDFVLTGTVETPLIDSGILLNETGILLENTGVIPSISGEDELLLDANYLDDVSVAPDMNGSGDVISSGTSLLPDSETTSVSSSSKPSSTSSSSSSKSSGSSGLSAKDIADLKALFGN